MFWTLFGRTITVTGLAIGLAAFVIAFGFNAALGADAAKPGGVSYGSASAPKAGQVEQGERAAQEWATIMAGLEKVALLLAVAITVSVSCLAAGIAVGKVGAAAMGAVSEKPEIMGRALVFVAVAEGIAIYGLIIGIMLLFRL